MKDLLVRNLILLLLGASMPVMAAETERSLTDDVHQTEETRGMFSPALVSPLKALGNYYYRQSRHRLALLQYERAQYILHRNEGVYTLSQLSLVDWMSIIQTLEGNFDKADILQRFYYEIYAHNYGQGSPETLPALSRLADWYYLRDNLWEAKRLAKSALAIVNRHDLGEMEHAAVVNRLANIDHLNRNWHLRPDIENVSRRMFYAIQQQYLGETSDPMIDQMHELADWHERKGELIAASAILDRAQTLQRRSAPGNMLVAEHGGQ